MNILILKPGQQKLAYSYFANGWDQPICAGQLDDYRSPEGSRKTLEDLAQRLAESVASKNISAQPDAIAVRGIFGGTEFTEPVVVSADVIRKLETLVPRRLCTRRPCWRFFTRAKPRIPGPPRCWPLRRRSS